MLFFLYVRSVVAKVLNINFKSRLNNNNKNNGLKSLWMSYRECVQVCRIVFGNFFYAVVIIIVFVIVDYFYRYYYYYYYYYCNFYYLKYKNAECLYIYMKFVFVFVLIIITI